MSIVGGAMAPPFMGHIADIHSMRVGFVVLLVWLRIDRHVRRGVAEAGGQG
jgi:fucose permease